MCDRAALRRGFQLCGKGWQVYAQTVIVKECRFDTFLVRFVHLDLTDCKYIIKYTQIM
jgi:hypothetical protein